MSDIKLSEDQLAMLKRCLNSVVVYEDLSDADRQIIKFLAKSGYVRLKSRSETHSNDYVFAIKSVPISASITEEGKAFLATIEQDDFRFRKTNNLARFSLIVSGIATLISLIALFTD